MDKQIIPVVAACITHGKGKRTAFLLHQKTEPRNPELMGKWEFPGGMMEYEESPELALRREIREELGREIILGKLIHAKTFISESREHYLILFYHCQFPDARELLPKDCAWFERGQFGYIDCLEEIEEVAGKLYAERR